MTFARKKPKILPLTPDQKRKAGRVAKRRLEFAREEMYMAATLLKRGEATVEDLTKAIAKRVACDSLNP